MFAKFASVTGTQLGVIVSAMKKDGSIEEPGGKGSMVYYLKGNPPKDLSKGRAPVSIEERREAQAWQAA